MKLPFFIQFYPTLKCNQRCVFCFNQGSSKNHHHEINKEKALKIVDIACINGIKEIDILGGEPFLLDWMHDFVKYASDSGLSLNISTNGSISINLEKIIKISSNSLKIGFSLLGFKEIHNNLTCSNNYDLIIKNIKLTISSEKNPIVKSVLMKKNMKEISTLLDFLIGIGVREYYLLHEDIIGRGKIDYISFPEYYDFYLKLQEKFNDEIKIGCVSASGFYKYNAASGKRCDAGSSKIAIMPDGSVFPCNLFAGMKDFMLGNIFTEDLRSILEHPSLNYFRKKAYSNPCKNTDCKYFINCTGGCPAHSYFFYNKLDLVDPRCNNL